MNVPIGPGISQAAALLRVATPRYTQRCNERHLAAAFGGLRGAAMPLSSAWRRARWGACYRELRRITLPRTPLNKSKKRIGA
jgi:hypothetical protein